MISDIFESHQKERRQSIDLAKRLADEEQASRIQQHELTKEEERLERERVRNEVLKAEEMERERRISEHADAREEGAKIRRSSIKSAKKLAKEELTRRLSIEPKSLKFNDDDNSSVISSSHRSQNSELEADANVILDASDTDSVDMGSKSYKKGKKNSDKDNSNDDDGGVLTSITIAVVVAAVGIAAFYFLRRR